MLTDIGWLELRPYREEDLPEMVEIHSCSYKEEEWTAADFRAFAAKTRQFIRVAVDSKQLVHAVLLYRVKENNCHIARLSVIPESRRHGVATKVLKTFTGLPAKVRTAHFTVRVRERNLAGQLLLRKAGFKCHKIEKKYYPNRDDGYCFEYTRAALVPLEDNAVVAK